MALEKYREKRSPDRTPEPFGGATAADGDRRSGIFVIQKHAARRLHYDFRLQMEGVLRSWAIPKGPSLNPADKRLAVMVEDHPLEYGDFEGNIPPGNYGAGAVIVWDRGTYSVLDPDDGDAPTAVRNGKLDLEMHGFKLRGAYTLVRTRGSARQKSSDNKEQWLLIKKRDEFASDEDLLEQHPRSVLSGLTIDEMRERGDQSDELSRAIMRLKPPKLRARYVPSDFPLTLAKTADESFDNKDWIFELKYDGIRALALRDNESVRLFGRNGREITRRYPEVTLALGKMPFQRFAIDGEIVALDHSGRPNFQLLQRRMHVDQAREAERLSYATPVTMFAFDLLAFDDTDLRSLPLIDRKELLGRIVRGEGPVRFCDHIERRGKAFFDAAANANAEGIVAKRRDAPYRGARTGDWIKIKCPRKACFVIGGWTDPAGSRTHFGALLIGQYEADGNLRFISRVGTGFNQDRLREIYGMLKKRERSESPFRKPRAGEDKPPRTTSHYCEPELVCEVRFSEWTDSGGIRHPSFLRMIDDRDPLTCRNEGSDKEGHASAPAEAETGLNGDLPNESPMAHAKLVKARPRASAAKSEARQFKRTHLDKVFWPEEGYTKGDLIEYYETMAPWMLPYLKDRPVVLTRYPDGYQGKSFYQKDAPEFAPSWIRTEKIWSEDTQRDIAYFILESVEAIAYMANMGAIPIHMWASRAQHLEIPDWLLFDIDPKGSTTEKAVIVARETGHVLREIGMRPYVKTSGQMGIHVLVGLVPEYTYDQARMFSEMVAQIVLKRVPESATLTRNKERRQGKAYIDYMQLSRGQTIVAPFSVRPAPHAPVSAPIHWPELKNDLVPSKWNIKTIPPRMARMKEDPFLAVITDLQPMEPALPKLEAFSESHAGK